MTPIPHRSVSSAQLNPVLRSSHRSRDTSPPLLVGVASSSVGDRWVIHHSDLQRGFIRSWCTACVSQLDAPLTQMLSTAHSARIAGRLWRPNTSARAAIPMYPVACTAAWVTTKGGSCAQRWSSVLPRLQLSRPSDQMPSLPEKEVMASEVDALCLMCRVKLPPMCTGPLLSSASGLEVGLAYWAWLLLLACVGDRCGGQLAAFGGL